MKRLQIGYISITLAIIVGLAIQGCNTSGCLDNRNSVPLAGFRSLSGQPISIDSVAIGGVGAPNDSLLSTGTTAISTVYLPFRSTVETTSFYLRYKRKEYAQAELTDTLTFRYEALPRFVSEECGAMYYYRITSVSHTRTLIDSIAVTDSLITNVERQQIEIIFRTSESKEGQTQ